jgi:hypothetical protein
MSLKRRAEFNSCMRVKGRGISEQTFHVAVPHYGGAAAVLLTRKKSKAEQIKARATRSDSQQ